MQRHTMFNIQFFLEKIEHLYLMHLNIFFYLVIWHQHHFDTITNFSTISCPSIQGCQLVFQTMFKLLEAPIHQWFGNCSHSENFWQLSNKTSMLESFLSTLASFSKSCSEQLFCRELVYTRISKKEFHCTHYLRNFLEC